MLNQRVGSRRVRVRNLEDKTFVGVQLKHLLQRDLIGGFKKKSMHISEMQR
jgi:hypothetical protein